MAAIRVGISIKDYEDMTPYQLNMYVKEFNKRKAVEAEEKIILTYMGAYWQRVKRMPSLKQVLKRDKPKKEMTDEEMLEQVKKLNALFKGTQE